MFIGFWILRHLKNYYRLWGCELKNIFINNFFLFSTFFNIFGLKMNKVSVLNFVFHNMAANLKNLLMELTLGKPLSWQPYYLHLPSY